MQVSNSSSQNGLYTIKTGDADDYIEITKQDGTYHIQVNDEEIDVPADEVALFRIETGAGNDEIQLTSLRGGDSAPVVVFAGEGNDLIAAGTTNDFLYGEEGNDWIFANAGNNLVDGGPGDDHLDNCNGNDLIRGGPGNDKIDDDLWRGPHADIISGGDGDDIIHLTEGDKVYGGAGNDSFTTTNGTFSKDTAEKLGGTRGPNGTGEPYRTYELYDY